MIISSFDEGLSNPAIYMNNNFFVIVFSVSLLPFCYFNERSSFEKFLIATRSDGGEVAEKIVKNGQVVDIDDVDQSRGDGDQDMDRSNSSRASLSSLASNEDGSNIIEEEFASVIKRLDPNDVERVVLSAQSDNEADDLNIKKIQLKMHKLREVAESTKKISPSHSTTSTHSPSASSSS